MIFYELIWQADHPISANLTAGNETTSSNLAGSILSLIFLVSNRVSNFIFASVLNDISDFYAR